jgi:LuxR family transcriptional regulator, maltose regulon positive regulatory protein
MPEVAELALDPPQIWASHIPPRPHLSIAVPPAPSADADRIIVRPRLIDQLERAGRVTVLSAPAGAGKTSLLRSWIRGAGLGSAAAWVPVSRAQYDPQSFWLSVADAVRGTHGACAMVHDRAAASEVDGWTFVEGLLADLASLSERLWLVIDDLDELADPEALRQFELLLAHAPECVRFAIATRRDLSLGLHRIRLHGELTELRSDDLRFTLDEARALFEAVGVEVGEAALALLVERTEGWAAGLRLAALSLSRHPDPNGFAAQFSGSDRIVGEYLLAEVLSRQPEQVRRLLLRTSILERVSGPLADRLTGGTHSERILHDLEDANAFVTPLEATRSWFRYHQLFADLLRLELRRTAPNELPQLHRTAAAWFAEYGHPVDAVRHAQSAEDWGLATRLLADHGLDLWLGGEGVAVDELLAGFPPACITADPELAGVVAANELLQGSLEEAERHLALAAQRLESVPADRRDRFEVRMAVVRMRVAARRGDLSAVVEQARPLLAPSDAGGLRLGLGGDLRAVALISLGIAELRSGRREEAEQHLGAGVALARRVNRPYLEIMGLAHMAEAVCDRSSATALQRSMSAIELAERYGCAQEPAAIAYAMRALITAWEGRLEDAAGWLARAQHALRPELDPATGVLVHHIDATLELARGNPEATVRAIEAAQQLEAMLVAPSPVAGRARQLLLAALVRTGDFERVERELSGLDGQELGSVEMRAAVAELRLAQNDPDAATAALVPVLDGSNPTAPQVLTECCLLEALACDDLGDAGGIQRALERALDLAEVDGTLLPFLLHPTPDLLQRHRRNRTAHGGLVAEILDLLGGGNAPSRREGLESLVEPLSEAEIRVLRYLPTNLTQGQIAHELFVSVNTVRTHILHLYSKLNAHSRREAVEAARGYGLLGNSLRAR